jgi:D-cysteine desulfhydrase
MRLPRLYLVHAPTPLVKRPALDAMLGVDLWIKRDDVTGGAEAGNKIRKLEFLLADARARGADTVLTCGGIQSNHARATALACAALGLGCVLFLRVDDAPAGPDAPAPRAALRSAGNVLLDRLAGAEIRTISRADYREAAAVMNQAAVRLAERGQRPYVIPEGGSNGLGAMGYVEAMREVREQQRLGLGGGAAPFDEIVHACGSGGTAAGVVLGAARHGTGLRVHAVAVCDDAATFERRIARIVDDARAIDPSLDGAAPLVVDEQARGPAYAVMDAEQRRFLAEVARASGTILDPVYTGKALFGLREAVRRGELREKARVLFLHTGGLPGLLAQGDAFADEVG